MNDKQMSRYPLNKEGYLQQYILTRARDKSAKYDHKSVMAEALETWNDIQNSLL